LAEYIAASALRSSRSTLLTQRTAVDVERLAARIEHLARHRHRGLEVRRVVDEHGELVAAEARHGVPGARAVDQAMRKRAQELVPGAVSQAVVHRLEVVEVDEQHSRRHAIGDVADGLVHAIGEQRAVGEQRQ
jgi:hypothetical protein